jgi:AcrR family transcriptional regulator
MSEIVGGNNIVEIRKRGRPPRDVQTILDAAVDVFAREGYASATIEMIASEAAASTATLYKRFTNKHGLFVAVLEQTTAQARAVHTTNRKDNDHPFAGMINRLEAHAIVSANPRMRGVMRAWVSEVRSHQELADLFAVKSGEELVTGLLNQIKKLIDEGYIAFDGDRRVNMTMAAQMMLGVVERFTLTRGLILGDNVPEIFPTAVIAEKAAHAMIGIWGTPKGVEAFSKISKTNATEVGRCA